MGCFLCDHDMESKTICEQCSRDLCQAEKEYGAEELNICAVSKLIDSRKKKRREKNEQSN